MNRKPRLIHAAAAVLHLASWVTAAGVIGLGLLDVARPPPEAVPMLVGLPALSRVLAWVLTGLFRGWPPAWLGAVSDSAFTWFIFTDGSDHQIAISFLSSVALACAIPTTWGIANRRWAFAPGVLGTAAALFALYAHLTGSRLEAHIPTCLMVGFATVAWLQLVLIHWALVCWRIERER